MNNKPIKPWLAGVLGFFLPGLGHIYSGSVRRGVFAYLFIQATIFLAAFIVLTPLARVNLFVSATIFLIASLAVIIDSIKTARQKREDYVRKRYNRWYIYLFIYLINAVLFQPVFTVTVKATRAESRGSAVTEISCCCDQ